MEKNTTVMAESDQAGALFVLSAPSGTGKTTLCTQVCRRIPDILFSVSYTTRAPRPGERPGIDYHFVSKDAFERKIKADQWAEWARVHDNYYGTSAEFLEAALAQGRIVLLDIDVQGAAQIRERYPDCITVFIMPPSMEALRSRLEARRTDDAATIEKRLANAAREIAQKDLYRHVIVNDDLQTAVDELIDLVEHYRRAVPAAGKDKSRF